MVGVVLRAPAGSVFESGFASIRRRLDIPETYPAAAVPATRGDDRHVERRDLRSIPFVAIDPPGSRDLDQVYWAERRPGGGYRVRYGIADLAPFVEAGSALDAETRRRGLTLYAPDGRTPLHPDDLGEGAASLLPEVDRPAVVWTLDIDDVGRLRDVHLERAIVRNRAALTYRQVQAVIDRGVADGPFRLLAEIGRLRQAQEVKRGGVSLELPAQEIVPDGEGYRLEYDAPVPAEGWNAQISLAAGMGAARLMIEGRVGVLRTLPGPESSTLTELRTAAGALGVPWQSRESYSTFIARLDPSVPAHAALLTQATRVFRGAGYASFDGDPPMQRTHEAIGAAYAHVTAPLRRLVDRFANEIVLAVCAGKRPPGWVLDALEGLPDLMAGARSRESAYSRALVDFVEAVVLANRVGEQFEAVVTSTRGTRSTVQLLAPAVICQVEGLTTEVGRKVTLRLESVALDPPGLEFRE